MLADAVEPAITRLRAATDLPIGVGFGISTPEQAAAVARFADASVVGSAIMRIVDVLPAPFGPRNPNVSPRSTRKSIPSTAVNEPNRFVRCRPSTSGVSTDGDATRLGPGRAAGSSMTAVGHDGYGAVADRR